MGLLLVVGLLALPALVRLALVRRVRRARGVAWRDSPVRESAAAFRGYKVAQLVVDERRDTAWLAGVTGRAYGVDVVAECGRARCEPPGLDCCCGFYAFRDRARALDVLEQLTRRLPHRGYVLLTVDLDGAVLEYALGFRAARQRVHRIEVPRTCAVCRHRGERRDADVLVADPAQRAEQVLMERYAPVGTLLPPGSSPARAVCAEHEPGRGARRLDLPTLRGLAGTEVDLLPVADGPEPPSRASPQ